MVAAEAMLVGLLAAVLAAVGTGGQLRCCKWGVNVTAEADVAVGCSGTVLLLLLLVMLLLLRWLGPLLIVFTLIRLAALGAGLLARPLLAPLLPAAGSGARGRWTRGCCFGGRGGARGSPPFLRSM